MKMKFNFKSLAIILLLLPDVKGFSKILEISCGI